MTKAAERKKEIALPATGKPSVTDAIALYGQENEVLRYAALVEKNSEHPLGEAIVRAAQERGLDLPNPDSFQAIPGHGVEARFGLSTLLLGNRKLMADRGVDIESLLPEAERLENEGKTVMFLAADGDAAGIIAVADTLKETSGRRPPIRRGKQPAIAGPVPQPQRERKGEVEKA